MQNLYKAHITDSNLSLMNGYVKKVMNPLLERCWSARFFTSLKVQTREMR